MVSNLESWVKNNSTIRLFSFNSFATKFFDNTITIRNSSFYQTQNSYMNQSYGIMVMFAYNFKVGKSIEKQKHTVEEQLQDNIIKMPVTFRFFWERNNFRFEIRYEGKLITVLSAFNTKVNSIIRFSVFIPIDLSE